MNKRYKQKDMKLLLHQNKVNMAGLIETRVKEKNMKTVLKRIVPRWKMINNYNDSPN